MSIGNRLQTRFKSMSNGLFAAAEFAAPQIGLLLAAPVLLRHLGAAQLGIWMLASAVVSSGSLLSQGFGDAAVKYIAMYRGRKDEQGIARVIRGMLAINTFLGGVLSLGLMLFAPYVAHHIAHLEPASQQGCIVALRIGAALLFLRSIDGVSTGALRGLEQYGVAARISMGSRLGALLAAVILAMNSHGVAAIMVATLCITTAALIAQAVAVIRHTTGVIFLPSLHRETMKMIADFGCYSWLQSIAALVFGQADRLVVGIFLGAPAVAVYGICTQAAQPIHGLIGAGFHVLFPKISARSEISMPAQLKPMIVSAFKTNLALAALFALPVILFSRPLLTLWMGRDFAHQGAPVLAILATGFAFLALNVTAHYASLAFGMVRSVTAFSLAAGAVMLAAMYLLTPSFGLVGAACARLVYGVITWGMYYPLLRHMRDGMTEPVRVSNLAWEES
jgi:O-antigen/teichoic acid export membrane protein